VLQNIADSRPKVRYLVAVDDSKTKMKSIVKVLYHFMHRFLSVLSSLRKKIYKIISDLQSIELTRLCCLGDRKAIWPVKNML